LCFPPIINALSKLSVENGYKNAAAKQLPFVAASCGSHDSKVTQKTAHETGGACPPATVSACILLSVDRVLDHWSALLFRFHLKLYTTGSEKATLFLTMTHFL
jgi:hypothetical protein